LCNWLAKDRENAASGAVHMGVGAPAMDGEGTKGHGGTCYLPRAIRTQVALLCVRHEMHGRQEIVLVKVLQQLGGAKVVTHVPAGVRVMLRASITGWDINAMSG